ncbi:MAG: TetR/AcrR family transcriptional regulator [Acidimicrobiales bacterium]
MTNFTSSPTPDRRPAGRDEVRAALIEATAELLVEQGPDVSVRTVAKRANVNHGLVHTYFGGKDQLVAAALDAINERAAAELDEQGFPPPDLASQRGGELARVIARMRLDDEAADPFTSHPIITSWRSALATARPDLPDDEVDHLVAAAATLGLGWAVFGDQIADTLGLDAEGRAALDASIARLGAELGGIPDSG